MATRSLDGPHSFWNKLSDGMPGAWGVLWAYVMYAKQANEKSHSSKSEDRLLNGTKNYYRVFNRQYPLVGFQCVH